MEFDRSCVAKKTRKSPNSSAGTPRSIWSGTIQFGLVAVPVQLMVAVRERSGGFHMMTPDGHCRLRRKLVCPDTGKEYDFKDTARGFEIAPDEYVLLDEAELKKLKPEAGRTIDIMDFVAVDAIDPIYFNHTYFVRPTEGGAKSFALLLQAMVDKRRAAIAQFVLRDRQHLVTLRPAPPVMALHTLFYADEVVEPASVMNDRKTPKVAAKELAMAEQLIGSLAGKFDPKKYHDEYRERVEELIRAKAEGEQIRIAPEPKSEQIVDLMDALKQSLARVNKPRSNGHVAHSRSRPRKRPARKAA
jgi:DNA end-binding protein Ku